MSEEIENESNDDIEPNKTVFMYAIKEGADVDEAERIAKAVALAKSKTLSGQFKDWFKSKFKYILAWLSVVSTIIGAAIVNWLEHITHFLG